MDWQAVALPSEERTAGWVGAGQLALEDDRATAQKYGNEHPDEFAGVWYTDEPAVRITVAFTDNLERHCLALRARLADPERFEVVRHGTTVAQRRRVRSELDRMIGSDPRIIGLSDRADSVGVDLRADGEVLAAELTQRYGEAVSVTVGAAPYPPSSIPTSAACPMPGVAPWPSGVRASLVLNDNAIPAGTDTSGSVTIVNGSNDRFTTEAAEPLTGLVFTPGEMAPVGRYAGVRGGVGLGVDLAPGEQTSIRVLIGTASCTPADGYAVPPGTYEVRAEVTSGVGRSRLSEPTRLRILPNRAG